MRIYTKTGDEGMSSLFDGKRVKKYDLRLQTYGEFDYLNVVVGRVREKINCNDNNNFKGADEIVEYLVSLQKDIFAICSILATEDLSKLPEKVSSVDWAERVSEMEGWIDKMTDELPVLKSFILPGGKCAGLWSHDARVVCRKCERYLVELMESVMVDEGILKYVNRMSDFFFTLSRYANFYEGVEELEWS